MLKDQGEGVQESDVQGEGMVQADGMKEGGDMVQGGGKPRPYYGRNERTGYSIVGAGANPALYNALGSRAGYWLLWGTVLVLVIVAIGMRLYQLGSPFDRDSYDEGVYWQSLRSMAAGHPLYQDIFYSQPPFFLLSTFPGYMLFGSSLWSARFGVAVVSLLGLLGAFMLGKALSGRIGSIAALLLLVVNPLYLAQSQTIQAEVSSVAFSLLAVGFAYLWWEHPEGMAGLCWAGLAGITLSLSILCKLLAAACVIPIALLMMARLWQIWQKQPGTSVASLWPILVGIGTSLLTMLVFLLPFLGSSSIFIQSVITFHTDAGTVLANTQQGNFQILQPALTSLLALAALYGIVTALVQQDWRVIPLLAWLLATVYILWHQVPLFVHHLVVLVPPLIALAVIGISSRFGAPAPAKDAENLPGISFGGSRLTTLVKYIPWLALLLIVATAVLNVREDRQYYRMAEARSVDGLAQEEARVAADLRNALSPDQLVVTDAQFVAGLANRSTPPALVDTSAVRINTGYLTLPQLIDAASQPQVHAVLFFSGRFHLSNVASFHDWVAQHFHLLHTYGSGQELWTR